MRRTGLVLVLAMLWIGASAATLPAETWPGHRHSPGYYGWYGYNAAAIYNLAIAAGPRRCMAQSERLLGQQIAAQQAAATQNRIRDAVAADGWRRSQQIIEQQQSDRDWWLQVSQQQIAQRQALAAKAATPAAATDIIKWPSLLQGPQFAAEREQIEAPYRRGTQGLSTPAAKDYEGMIKAVERMKLILKGMSVSVTAQEYFDTEAFLARLAAEARGRLEKAAKK
jgi:hypothetical protein